MRSSFRDCCTSTADWYRAEMTRTTAAVQCDAAETNSEHWRRLEHLSLDVTYAGTRVPILGADVTPALRSLILRFVTRPENEGVGPDVAAALRVRAAAEPSSGLGIRRLDLRIQVASFAGGDDAAAIVRAARSTGIPDVAIRWRNNHCHIRASDTTAGHLATALAGGAWCDHLAVRVEGRLDPTGFTDVFAAAAVRSRSVAFGWDPLHHPRCGVFDPDLWESWTHPAARLRALRLDFAAIDLSTAAVRYILWGAVSGKWLPALEDFRFDLRFNADVGNKVFGDRLRTDPPRHPAPPLRILRLWVTANAALDAAATEDWLAGVRRYIAAGSRPEDARPPLDASVTIEPMPSEREMRRMRRQPTCDYV